MKRYIKRKSIATAFISHEKIGHSCISDYKKSKDIFYDRDNIEVLLVFFMLLRHIVLIQRTITIMIYLGLTKKLSK